MASRLEEIEVRLTLAPDRSHHVGTLARRDHQTYFEYHPEWIERGIELSPLSLPLKPGLHHHQDLEFGPLPGLFDDSLPDGWGLLLMDRYFQSQKIDPASVSPLQRLAWVGSDTMGALTYHPPTDRQPGDDEAFNLRRLARAAREVFDGAAGDVLPELLRSGGSPGGARPKVLIGLDPETDHLVAGEGDLPDGHEAWIVKFYAHQDSPDNGAIEFAYANMARAAGLNMPQSRLFETAEGDRFFGVQRFDRATGNQRFHVHTFGNLIHANFRIPSCDYRELLQATRVLTLNQSDIEAAFRWMTFNVFAHNRDDHAKNFAFLMDAESGEWRLAPAYDLTWSVGPGGEHTTSVAGEGRNPGRDNLMTLAREFDLGSAAPGIIDQVAEAVARWSAIATDAGVTQESMKGIQASFPTLQ